MDIAVEKYYQRRKNRTDAKFEEDKHPRGKDGKFTSGGGTGGSTQSASSGVASETNKKTPKQDRNSFLGKFKSVGKTIQDTKDVRKNDVISDGESCFVVKNVGGYRVEIAPLTDSDNTFDGEKINKTGELKSIGHFEKYKVVGNLRDEDDDDIGGSDGQKKSSAKTSDEGKAPTLSSKEKGKFKNAKFIDEMDEVNTGDIISDGTNKYIVGTKGGYRTGLKTEKNGSEVMHGPNHFVGKFKVIGHMDSADIISNYRERRAMRMQERFDANPRVAYGIARGMGIDTTGMSPKEVYEAIAKEGGNARGKRPHGNKEYELSKKSDKKPYKDTYKTPNGTAFPKIKSGAKWDNSVLSEVDRLAKQGGHTKKYDRVMKSISDKDVVYQKGTDGTIVASIPGLSQKFDNKMSGRSEECNRIYKEKIENGKQIVSDMKEVTDSLGCRLMGLENCFKGGSSASGKIDRKRKKDIASAADLLKKGKINEEQAEKMRTKTDEEYTRDFDDIVRFTVLADHNDTVKSVENTIKTLEKKGYTLSELDNKWLPTKEKDGTIKPSEYKAVHLTFTSPTGESFEVQVHSPETMNVKNKNHALYEEQRKPTTSKERAGQLGAAMAKNTATLKEPDGIMNLASIKKEKE